MNNLPDFEITIFTFLLAKILYFVVSEVLMKSKSTLNKSQWMTVCTFNVRIQLDENHFFVVEIHSFDQFTICVEGKSSEIPGRFYLEKCDALKENHIENA